MAAASQDEDSPNGPNGPPGEHVTGMMAAAAAAAASATLAGCDNGPAGDGSGLTVSVPRLAFTTWTVLCMLYSRSPWHDMKLCGETSCDSLSCNRTANNRRSATSLGLVTLTLKRALGRLKKTQDSSNH